MALVGIHQLADVLKCTPRHIQRLVGDGVLERPQAKGQYDLGRSMAAWIRYKQTQEEKEKKHEDDDDRLGIRAMRARLLSVQAEREELALKRERAEVIPLDIYEHENTLRIMAARQRILQLPSRLASILEMQERGFIRERVTQECHKLLEVLSNDESGRTASNGNGNGHGSKSSEPAPGSHVEAAADPSSERMGGKKYRADAGKKRSSGTSQTGKISD